MSRLKIQLEQKNAELRKALDEINTLRGFLPICVSCKNIRDDKGYWHQVESYIRNHSEVEFSHSLCPECSPKYFPDEIVHENNDSTE